MSIQLLGDSCCDTTPALKNLLGLKTVPIKILVGDNLHFVDDETLDTKHLLTEMKRSKCATSTACPAPEEYAEVMRACDECIVVTLTS
ncbi:MAG: DegV family protein, partial [Pygmaiobacter sp.]